MTQSLPDQPTAKPDYLSIAQLSVSGLGLVLSLVTALGMAIFGAINLIDGSNLTSITTLFSTLWISLLMAGLAVPSIVYSIRRLGGRSPALPEVRSFRLVSMLILVWPLILLLGNLVAGQPRLAWIFLPPLQLLAVGIPALWLVEITRHKLPVKSPQRGWGLVNFSIFITTQVLMVVEILALLVIFVLLGIWISSQPELMRLVERLAQRLVNAPASMDDVLEIIRPYLQNPLLIFGALAVVSGLIPLIEELLKPLALWMLAGRRLSPAEGFVAGGLCGAAFGLVESLFYLSNPFEEGWALLAVGRAGTVLLHTATSALVGWGMAYAWQKGAYLRLALSYLLAVFLHGLWNALSLVSGFSGAPAGLQHSSGLVSFAPFGVAFLALLLLLLLWTGNGYLQKNPGPTLEAAPTGLLAEQAREAESTDLDKIY